LAATRLIHRTGTELLRGESAMIEQTWLILSGAVLIVFIALITWWLRMPAYRWYCRRCKKIASISRFRPAKCACGTQAMVAYFCKDCGSWNTTPRSHWHCASCSSQDISLGVEFVFHTAMWRFRNTNV